MGNQQPKQSEEGLVQHERLGSIKIIEIDDKQSDQIISEMQINKLIQSQRVVEQWKSQMNRIDDSESRQILLLPIKYQFYKMGMCGSNGTLEIIYENLSYVLKGQIQNRLKINRYFEERQVWYLLYNMIRAGNKFERIKRKVGNLHPNSILINDDGQIKIISTCSMPGELDNFEAMVQNHQGYAFLAPQQLANDAVQNASYPTGVNPCLAEVFSIGMTILSAGTLLECDSVYEKRKDSIKLNQNELQHLLKIFKQRYSLFLSDVLSEMLAISPNNRKSSSEIYEILYKYENEILDLEPFSPPQRYFVPQTEIRASNFHHTNQIYPQIHHQVQGPPIVASNIYGSNLYNRHTYEGHPVVQTVLNDLRVHRSTLPVQQVMSGSQAPGQIHPMSESLSYSSQFRPILSPTGQQSGVYAQRESYLPESQRQSYAPDGQRQSYLPGTSSAMTSSFQLAQQAPVSTIGPNVIVTQSNYLPNYQFRQ